jgi:hypothetical protein
VYSKLGWAIAVVMAIFPFITLLVKLAQTESIATTLIVAAICAIFFAVVLIASRVTVAPEPEGSAGTLREPQPPVAWSWDGVNRQPDAGEEQRQDEGIRQ